MARPLPRERKTDRRERARRVAAALAETYPGSTCALDHDSPFQLLAATVLSAQTTDLKVNEVTPELFARFPDAAAMAQAGEDEVGHLIASIGLWRSKARNLVALSRRLVAEHDGEVPRNVKELKALPGVGKKTATAALGTAFGIPAGITVDTHMLRINRLLRLVTGKVAQDADRMSEELETLLPPQSWPAYTHRIIDHGRLVCVARRPRCGVCVLAEQALCPSAFKEAVGYAPRNDEREPASAKGLSWRARHR